MNYYRQENEKRLENEKQQREKWLEIYRLKQQQILTQKLLSLKNVLVGRGQYEDKTLEWIVINDPKYCELVRQYKNVEYRRLVAYYDFRLSVP